MMKLLVVGMVSKPGMERWLLFNMGQHGPTWWWRIEACARDRMKLTQEEPLITGLPGSPIKTLTILNAKNEKHLAEISKLGPPWAQIFIRIWFWLRLAMTFRFQEEAQHAAIMVVDTDTMAKLMTRAQKLSTSTWQMIRDSHGKLQTLCYFTYI